MFVCNECGKIFRKPIKMNWTFRPWELVCPFCYSCEVDKYGEEKS